MPRHPTRATWLLHGVQQPYAWTCVHAGQQSGLPVIGHILQVGAASAVGAKARAEAPTIVASRATKMVLCISASYAELDVRFRSFPVNSRPDATKIDLIQAIRPEIPYDIYIQSSISTRGER